MFSTAAVADATLPKILRYAVKVLRPIVRTLLRFGVSAEQMNELVRWLYVDEFYSQQEFWNRSKPFGARAALLTGLSRKEVSRLRQIDTPGETVLTKPQNRAARVLAGWVNDPAFHSDGKPSALPLSAQGRRASFERLVHLYSGDLPARTVLDELIRANNVRLERDTVHLVEQAYGPCAAHEEQLNAAGLGIKRVAETVDFNLAHVLTSERRLQRVWYQCNVPLENVAEARRIITEDAVQAGRAIDQKVARIAHPRRIDGRRYADVGVGMYYYEDPE